MPENDLKGITVNGVPLNSYLQEACNSHVAKEVMRIVRESGGKSNFYHHRRVKYKSHEERNGPVITANNMEIHEKNRDGYIKKAMTTNDIRSAIIGVLLSTEKPISAFDIKELINAQIPSDPVKSAQIRVHIGYIMKSELRDVISREYTQGRARGARYKMMNGAKMQHSFESACEAANRQVQEHTHTRAPKEKKLATGELKLEKDKKPNIEFILTDKNELPVLKVEGEINVNVHFHFSWGK